MFPCSCFSLLVHRRDDATLPRNQLIASAPAPKGAWRSAHAHRASYEAFWRRKGGCWLLTGGWATVDGGQEPEG